MLASFFTHPIKKQHLFQHESKRSAFLRFVLLLVVLFAYFAYLSLRYGLLDGGLAAFLTWSFFVLCTPIADAGFLLDFPLRVLFNVRMVFSEMMVWVIAITLNVTTLTLNPKAYDETFLTTLFKEILTHPYPYWAIILLSALGTFLSVVFGDELMDVVRHKERVIHRRHALMHRFIVIIVFILILFFLYEHLLSALDVHVTG